MGEEDRLRISQRVVDLRESIPAPRGGIKGALDDPGANIANKIDIFTQYLTQNADASVLGVNVCSETLTGERTHSTFL